jgi:hypothetical protein
MTKLGLYRAADKSTTKKEAKALYTRSADDCTTNKISNAHTTVVRYRTIRARGVS